MNKPFISNQQVKSISLLSNKPYIPVGSEEKFNRAVDSIRFKINSNNYDDKEIEDGEKGTNIEIDRMTIQENGAVVQIKDDPKCIDIDDDECECESIRPNVAVALKKDDSIITNIEDSDAHEISINNDTVSPLSDAILTNHVNENNHINCRSFDDIIKQFNEMLLTSKQTDSSKWEFSYIDHSCNQLELSVNKISASNLTITVNSSMSNYSMAKIVEDLNIRLSTKGWKSTIDKSDKTELYMQAVYAK